MEDTNLQTEKVAEVVGEAKPIEPKVATDPKPAFSTQDFINAYNKLVSEMGYQIAVFPIFVPSQDGKDWKIALQKTIVPVQK